MNFRQHVFSGLIVITFIYSLILTYYSKEYVFVLTPFLFIIGNIMPDIDLPAESKYTKWSIYIFLPFLLGGSLLFYNPYFAFVFIIVSMIVLQIINRTTYHWQYVHSLGFMFLVGLTVGIIFTISAGEFVGKIAGLSIAGGFFLHLFADQLYSDLRGKTWKRQSLKIWNNNNKYDPVIRMVRLFQILVKRKKK